MAKKKKCQDKDDEKCQVVVAAFPPMFRLHSTTPKTTPDAPATTSTIAPGAAPGVGEAKPSRARVFHELRCSLGLLKEDNERFAPDPGFKGYAMMNPLAINMRPGGPTVGGPGFWPTVEPGQGGRYNFEKSPGLGFRSPIAWRVWQAALEIIERDKTLPPPAIFQAATSRAGVRYGQLDPAEARLLEMGIEWVLGDPGSLSAKRDLMGRGSAGA